MRNQKGLTILELLVALGIFAIVAAAAMSFYQYQSKQGVGAARKKMAEEQIRMALSVIGRDIMQAGLGLQGREALAIFVQNGTSATDPDELYLSYSGPWDMDLTGDKPSSFYAGRQSSESGVKGSRGTPGQNRIWFKLSNSTSITLKDLNAAIDANSVGSLILDVTPYFIRDPKAPADPKTTVTVSQTTDQADQYRHDVQLAWTTAYDGTAAPAVSYRLVLDSDTTCNASNESLKWSAGRLLRNGVALAGADPLEAATSALASELRPLVKITDFQIRCGYKSAVATITCADCPSTAVEFQTKVKDLRLVEVTIRYLVRDPAGGFMTPDVVGPTGYRIPNDCTTGPWTVGGTQTFLVSPRNIVMPQYLATQ